MKFKKRLLQGTLIKRYKRFFVDISYNNKVITGHCPNTGSMMGLLNKGSKVWFSKTDDPNRKLKYTLQIIEFNKKKIGINTLITNKIVRE
jgi:sugar fermentation stimulation protein A